VRRNSKLSEYTRRRDIALAAKLLSGKAIEPTWLKKSLGTFIDSRLTNSIRGEAGTPTPKQIAAMVRAARDAADVLLKIISRPLPLKTKGPWLDAGWIIAGSALGHVMEEDKATRLGLLSLRARADDALKGLARPGRGKRTRNTPEWSAKAECAACIVLAWHLIHKEFPRAGSDAACQAANAIWSAAGGDPSKRDHQDAGTSGWRRDLASVLPSPKTAVLPGETAFLHGRVWQYMGSPTA
jgi:hypothetical protein